MLPHSCMLSNSVMGRQACFGGCRLQVAGSSFLHAVHKLAAMQALVWTRVFAGAVSHAEQVCCWHAGLCPEPDATGSSCVTLHAGQLLVGMQACVCGSPEQLLHQANEMRCRLQQIENVWGSAWQHQGCCR